MAVMLLGHFLLRALAHMALAALSNVSRFHLKLRVMEMVVGSTAAEIRITRW
jgi:hypothetical protein